MGVYENVKRALQDIVAPEIKALRVEIKRLDEKIETLGGKMEADYKRLDEKIDSLREVEIKRLDEKIESLSRGIGDKINSLRNELLAEIRRVDGRIDSLDSHLQVAMDIRERLAKVEAKLAGG
ncbi:MAG TPA: hypothetical protein ENL39_04765 [Candidatus Aerophobetes bacterium]|uniref:DUF1640 domain-containing protein n=1 Tax=Aerophobetes bacterium TaxID=2030807 RepID=A0A7V5HZJ4_UNCAE|nr:hypothetical protein [Candidatus Aerophobetes bacterium]